MLNDWLWLGRLLLLLWRNRLCRRKVRKGTPRNSLVTSFEKLLLHVFTFLFRVHENGMMFQETISLKLCLTHFLSWLSLSLSDSYKSESVPNLNLWIVLSFQFSVHVYMCLCVWVYIYIYTRTHWYLIYLSESVHILTDTYTNSYAVFLWLVRILFYLGNSVIK